MGGATSTVRRPIATIQGCAFNVAAFCVGAFFLVSLPGCSKEAKQDKQADSRPVRSDPKAGIAIVSFTSRLEQGLGGTEMRAIEAAVRNNMSHEVYLSQDDPADAEPDSALAEQRHQAGAAGPYRLGLERLSPQEKDLYPAAGYRWVFVQKLPQDKPRDTPPLAVLPPGTSRTFADVMIVPEYESCRWRACSEGTGDEAAQ
jgi:hypothetical protein